MHEDDVSAHTASSLFARNDALKFGRKRNRPRHFTSTPGRRARSVTGDLVIVVTAVATNATGIMVWKYTVPTPGSAASVASVIIGIFVRVLRGWYTVKLENFPTYKKLNTVSNKLQSLQFTCD